MKIIWLLPRACCGRNGLGGLAELSAVKVGADWLKQADLTTSGPVGLPALARSSQNHKQTSLWLLVPLIRPERHEAARSIPCRVRSAPPHNAAVSIFPLWVLILANSNLSRGPEPNTSNPVHPTESLRLPSLVSAGFNGVRGAISKYFSLLCACVPIKGRGEALKPKISLMSNFQMRPHPKILRLALGDVFRERFCHVLNAA